MANTNFYWRHRCGDAWSPMYSDPTLLHTHHDRYFEDYMVIEGNLKSETFMLRTCGFRSCDPHYCFLNRVIDRYSIHVILSGEAWVDGMAVHAGDIIFFEKNRMHNFSSSVHDPCQYAWVTFKNEKADQMLKEIGVTSSSKIYHTDNLDQLCAVFYDMLYTHHPEKNVRVHLEACLTNILALSKNPEPKKKSSDAGGHYSAHQKYIDTALQFIEENKGKKIKIEEISQAVGLNENYFRNLFKKELGVSPLNYLIEKRIESAATLLKSSNYAISEIAEFVGFRDYRQFSELFKKKTGISPSAYRSNMKK